MSLKLWGCYYWTTEGVINLLLDTLMSEGFLSALCTHGKRQSLLSLSSRLLVVLIQNSLSIAWRNRRSLVTSVTGRERSVLPPASSVQQNTRFLSWKDDVNWQNHELQVRRTYSLADLNWQSHSLLSMEWILMPCLSHRAFFLGLRCLFVPRDSDGNSLSHSVLWSTKKKKDF